MSHLTEKSSTCEFLPLPRTPSPIPSLSPSLSPSPSPSPIPSPSPSRRRHRETLSADRPGAGDGRRSSGRQETEETTLPYVSRTDRRSNSDRQPARAVAGSDRTRLSPPVLLNGREVGAVGGPRHGFTVGGTRAMGLGTQLWLVQHVNRLIIRASSSEADTAIDMGEWMMRWWEYGVKKNERRLTIGISDLVWVIGEWSFIRKSLSQNLNMDSSYNYCTCDVFACSLVSYSSVIMQFDKHKTSCES